MVYATWCYYCYSIRCVATTYAMPPSILRRWFDRLHTYGTIDYLEVKYQPVMESRRIMCHMKVLWNRTLESSILTFNVCQKYLICKHILFFLPDQVTRQPLISFYFCVVVQSTFILAMYIPVHLHCHSNCHYFVEYIGVPTYDRFGLFIQSLYPAFANNVSMTINRHNNLILT